jgi:hypothetical protein
MAEKGNKKTTTDAEFLGRDGEMIKVADIISEDDCWFLRKEGKWVLSHKAIQKIATLAGISKKYDVEESEIEPSYKNELEHIVRVTIHCPVKRPGQKKGCIHDEYEDSHTATGESNKLNTTANRGRAYLRKMAEKRAFDIAVLEFLGLNSIIFSEEESENFMSKENKAAIPSESITNVELENLGKEISLLAKSTTKTELRAAVKEIKSFEKDGKEYNATEKAFLKELHARRVQEIDNVFQ